MKLSNLIPGQEQEPSAMDEMCGWCPTLTYTQVIGSLPGASLSPGGSSIWVWMGV
jgi:hypothetical protein